MARSNGDIVRALYDVWNAGGSGKELIDAEIEYVNPPDAVEPGTRHGRGGWLEALRRSRETLGDYRIEVEETIESGEMVLALVVIEVNMPASGIEAGFRQGHVWTIRDGRAVRLEWFNDPARARELFEDRGPDPASGAPGTDGGTGGAASEDADWG